MEVKKTSASSKIVFNRSSSVLTKSSKAKLKKLAKTVGAGSKITVTASVGPLNGATKAQRNALAKLRAEAIFKYLKSISKISHSFKIKLIESGTKPVTIIKAN
jgi:outer membrane protein OmpA-like peptidoglycan-associated protein